MEFLNNKKSYIIIVFVSIIILGTVGAYVYKVHNNDNTKEYFLDEQMEDYEDNTKEEIIVHVAGEINKPGIVILEEGDRIVDAIEEAGGATDKADLNKLNLAQTLSDGEKIYVPSIEDTDEVIENNINTTQEKININTATIDQLTNLDGIGPSLAQKIIEYRKTNGSFKSTEELKNITGIGDSKYEVIKEKVVIK